MVCDSFFPFCILVSNCGYQYSSKAFLFSLVNHSGWAPLKLLQTGRHGSGANPYTVVQAMDPHLVEETIFTLPAMPHPTQNLTRTSDTPTVHHPATVIAAPPIHSWLEVAVLNPMKSKCFMKLLETNELK